MPRRLKASVEHLIAAGFDVPPELHKVAREHDYKLRGVGSVWKCNSKKCGKVHEQPLVISSMSCSCQHSCRRIWPE